MISTVRVSSAWNLETTDPVLAAFRKSGALSKGDPPYALRTATLEELAIIEKYFALCERK